MNDISSSQSYKLFHWLFLAIGVICLLFAMLVRRYSEVVSDLMVSLGATLIATSLLSYLYQSLGKKSLTDYIDEIKRSLMLVQTSTELGMINMWKERREISSNSWNTFTAEGRREVWLYGIAEHKFAIDESFYRILSEGTAHGCNYKILLLDPESQIIDSLDAMRTGHDVIRTRVQQAITLFKRRIEENRGKQGTIELKIYDEYPSYSIVRSDEEMYVTFYLSSFLGNNCPTFQIHSTSRGLFPKFCRHFEDCWNSAKLLAKT